MVALATQINILVSCQLSIEHPRYVLKTLHPLLT